MKNFIVTFGQQDTHRVNGYTFDKDSVAIIKAESHEEARGIAFDLFNGKFHRCVTEEEYDTKGHAFYYPKGKHKAN